MCDDIDETNEEALEQLFDLSNSEANEDLSILPKRHYIKPKSNPLLTNNFKKESDDDDECMERIDSLEDLWDHDTDESSSSSNLSQESIPVMHEYHLKTHVNDLKRKI